MGKKSTTETVSAVFQAFLMKRSWKQVDLASHVGVGTPALRKRLIELQAQGLPLEREEDPPDVWWSMSPHWFPGAVVFSGDEIGELLRQLGRLPRSEGRDRFIKRIIQAAPQKTARSHEARSAVVSPPTTAGDERYLRLVEDAAERRVTLSFQYFTVSRGSVEQRSASVQRISVGPPTRMLAVCHRSGNLKWFRLEGIHEARLDPQEPYRTASAAEVDAIMKESLDGFHHGAAPVRCSFVVEEAEARWVEKNLPGPMEKEIVPEGRRFTATTSGVLRLARFVVGLGRAARIETPELAAVARELARGALENTASADARLNEASASSNGSTG